MLPNSEFIKNRFLRQAQDKAIEIGWAVFRCAELVKQPNLRAELEGMAVSLVANFGHFESNNGQIELPHINRLAAIIKLAEAVNEIKPLNAQVLYRELKKLEDSIRENIPTEEIKELRLDEMFKGSGALNTPKSESFKNLPIKSRQEKEVAVHNEESMAMQGSPAGEGFNSAVDEQINVASFGIDLPIAQPALAKPNYAKRILTLGRSKSLADSRSSSSASSAKQDIPMTREDLAIQDSWQSKIYLRIKELGEASTKELSNIFPEISERTIRFYLQRLSEAGFIDKIGSTGPGSYYKYKE